MMTWLWILFGSLVAIAGLRVRARLRQGAGRSPRIDDDAIHRILHEGRLEDEDEDGPLDMDAAARAEEEFWDESWDEPEEYRS